MVVLPKTNDAKDTIMDMPLAITKPATERQMNYLRILVEQKYAPEDREEYTNFLDTAVISVKRASEIIEYLKTLPRVYASAEMYTPSEDLEVGLYLVDGRAYKVKRAVYGSGFLYAVPWNEDTQCFGEKEPGAIRKIRASHRMTLEQAGPYGLAMSACAHCGRPLTDEGSIALGLGPICAGKY